MHMNKLEDRRKPITSEVKALLELGRIPSMSSTSEQCENSGPPDFTKKKNSKLK